MASTLKDITSDVILDFLENHGYVRQCFKEVPLDKINSDMWKGIYSRAEEGKKKGKKPYAEEPERMFFLYKNSYRRNLLVEYTAKTFTMIQLNESDSKLLTDAEHNIDDFWKAFLKIRGLT